MTIWEIEESAQFGEFPPLCRESVGREHHHVTPLQRRQIDAPSFDEQMIPHRDEPVCKSVAGAVTPPRLEIGIFDHLARVAREPVARVADRERGRVGKRPGGAE